MEVKEEKRPKLRDMIYVNERVKERRRRNEMIQT